MAKQHIKFSAPVVGSTVDERARYQHLGKPPEEAIPWIEQQERIIVAHDQNIEMVKGYNPRMSIPDPDDRRKLCFRWLGEKHRWESTEAFVADEGITDRTLRNYLNELGESIPRDIS